MQSLNVEVNNLPYFIPTPAYCTKITLLCKNWCRIHKWSSFLTYYCIAFSRLSLIQSIVIHSVIYVIYFANDAAQEVLKQIERAYFNISWNISSLLRASFKFDGTTSRFSPFLFNLSYVYLCISTPTHQYSYSYIQEFRRMEDITPSPFPFPSHSPLHEAKYSLSIKLNIYQWLRIYEMQSNLRQRQ